MKNYCSWCFNKVYPILINSSKIKRNVYQCPNCEKKIVECRVCKNYARWDKLEVQSEKEIIKKSNYHQFCAEHQHAIPNFDTTNLKLAKPSDFKEVYKYSKKNYVRISKNVPIIIGSTVLFGPLAYVSAPAIGGTLGVLFGYTGAVATNTGLAFLGGGSLATGGLGMAGGTSLITAVGSSVGGTLGAYIGNAYLGEVKDFDIKDISIKQENVNSKQSIITINGFLNQKDEEIESWEEYINGSFNDSDWFHLNWESKKLSDIGKMIRLGVQNKSLKITLKIIAKKASKEAIKKIGPLFTAQQLIVLATNPWHTAMFKAEKTGILLADIIRRCKGREFVLVGHSLGARVIMACLSSLSTTDTKKISEVHLMGGAVSSKQENWIMAKSAVKNNIYNYYSSNDEVLKYLFSVGTFFTEKPIGRNPIKNIEGVVNVDVSEYVKGHMDYKQNAAKFKF